MSTEHFVMASVAIAHLAWLAGMAFLVWREQVETNRLLDEIMYDVDQVLYDLNRRTDREMGR